jgi:hypothetical protein
MPNLYLSFADTSIISTTRWALRAWHEPAGALMCVGMTRNPMRLTGTITALSANVQSTYRLTEGRIVRAFEPGCSFQMQSGTRKPD